MFDVDLTTGILSYDDTSIDAEYVNGKLIVSGDGTYYLENGNVMEESDPFLQPDREVSARGMIKLSNGTEIIIDDSDIVRFSSAQDIGNQFPIGTTVACAYSLTIANVQREWDYGGAKLHENTLDGATVSVEIGSNGVYVPHGLFLVERVDNQNDSTVLTLYGSDYMANIMLTPWDDNLTYPATGYEIQERVCELTGIDFPNSYWSGTVTTEPTLDPGVTCRDIVGWLAMMAFMNAYFDASGNLIYKLYRDSPVYDDPQPKKILPNFYTKFVMNMPMQRMNFLVDVSGDEDGVVTLGYSVVIHEGLYYKYTIAENPYFDYTDPDWQATFQDYFVDPVCAALRDTVSGLVTFVGDGATKMFDVVRIIRLDQSFVYLPVLTKRVNYDGSLRYEIGSSISSGTLNYAESHMPFGY